MEFLGWMVLLHCLSRVFGEPAREVHNFVTEPDIQPQILLVMNSTLDKSELSSGYLFISPQMHVIGGGPKIYTTDGMLIWDGKYAIDKISQNFFACDFDGNVGQHLCWHESTSLGALRNLFLYDMKDYNVVMDNTYTKVHANYSNTGRLNGPPDPHELNPVSDHSFIHTVYSRRQMDLSAWKGPKEGYAYDACVQEVDIHSGKPFFTWCYLEHIPIETYVYLDIPGQVNYTLPVLAGTGKADHPWDFCHPNSADKNEEGDYILSCRHINQVIKIAGPNSPNGEPGSVLWKLGGKSNSFEMPFNFTRQHDVRFRYTGSSESIISIFDNAWDGTSKKPSAKRSSAKIISINNQTMEATLLKQYDQPNGFLCLSGGNVQYLPNKNIFVAWGFTREVSEFTYEGKLLWHARAKTYEEPGPSSSYRNYKFPWVGKPSYPPKLVAYSFDCAQNGSYPLLAYVSWNGATEVKSWSFFTSEFSYGPWTEVGTFNKTQFETKAHLSNSFYPYVRVDAIDENDQVLSTAYANTFVPNKKARKGCDEESCFKEDYLHYDTRFSCADSCQRLHSPLLVVSLLIFVVLCNELRAWYLERLLCAKPIALSGTEEGLMNDMGNGSTLLQNIEKVIRHSLDGSSDHLLIER